MSRPCRIGHRRIRLVLAALGALLGGLGARTAQAEVRTYVIAIGYNEPPAELATAEGLRALRYADDDAAAIYSFTRDLAHHATLLTVLDLESQRRFPGLAEHARPPSLAELRRAVDWHRQRFETDRREGHDPVLILTYSGHGARGPGSAPSLTLLDGPLTQAILYDEVLAKLPARYIHLVVDACHAEAVVRPRDLSADSVAITEQDARNYAERTTLQRFPHVGAIVATTTQAQAHEWDAYQRGVFTYEVLSALRGAADVDGNGRIEYSEVHAFLAAANREVSDPRARLTVLVRPPAVNARAAILDLGTLRNSVRLVGAPARLGRFHLEDTLGNRLADVRAEPGFRVSLALPAGETLFLRTPLGEAEVRGQHGERVKLDRVALRPLAVASRGAVASSLRRGLFSTPFGPTYYRGFIDSHEELVPVPLRAEGAAEVDLADAPARPSLRPAWASFGVAGALLASAAVFTGLTFKAKSDYEGTQLERPAADATARYQAFRGAAIGAGVGAALAAGVGAYVLLTRLPRGPARAALLPGPGQAGLALDVRF